MDLYLIARQQIEKSTADQFGAAPEPTPRIDRAAPRPGIVTTLRLRLSADLRALAAAIEPHTPFTPQPGTSNR